jgi:hypothetical protein
MSFRSAMATGVVFRCCLWLVSLLLVQPAFWTTFAKAQSPASIVKEFDLLGIWADDCRAPSSPANQYATFSLTSRGHVELRNEFGPDYDEMVYRIVGARRLSHFRLSLRQLLTTDDHLALNTVMMKANGRIRVWSSHGSDGIALVEDGMMPTANDRETGWMTRCDEKWTDEMAPGPQKLSEGIPIFDPSWKIASHHRQGRDVMLIQLH